MSEQQYHQKIDSLCEQMPKLTALVEEHIRVTAERDIKIDELLEFWKTLTYGRKFVLIVFGFAGGIIGGLATIVAVVWGLLNIVDKIK